VYGGCEPDPDRLGVIPFNFERVPHGKAAAILGDEWGIGTRSGCFCAHPYVQSLLGIDLAGAHALAARATAGQKRGLPGMVRASIGLSSSAQDIDRLVDAVSAIARGEHDDTYVEDAKGEWT
jgi:selenocysteine lyase/cysteine desulfurase